MGGAKRILACVLPVAPTASARADGPAGARRHGADPAAAADAAGSSRREDLVDKGVRQDRPVGRGLVAGLDGTGDSRDDAPFGRRRPQVMPERLGVSTHGAQLRTVDLAAVIAADPPPFSSRGTRIDVAVSALGDAESLEGGTPSIEECRHTASLARERLSLREAHA